MPRFKNIPSSGMIKKLIRAIYAAFISIVLLSFVLVTWTSYALFFQSAKNTEIINVIQDIYVSQKTVVVDIVELSKILIKDTSENIIRDNKNTSVEMELISEPEKNAQVEESLKTEDNGDNPLGIIIESTLPEVSENRLPEISEEPLVNDNDDFPMNNIEKEMGMGMNY